MSHADAPDPLDTLHPLKTEVTRLETQEILNIKHNKFYVLARLGVLDVFKDGPRTLVTIESIRRCKASRPKATFLPPAPKQNNFHTLKNRRTKAQRKRT